MPFKRFKRIFFANFRNQHDRVTSVHLIRRQSERLPQEPFDTVSLHAFAVSFADGYPHRGLVRRTVDHRQRRRERAFAFLEKFLKIRLFFESEIFHF